MSEIVFVLGAGASVHANAPVMANFLETAREIDRNIRADDPIKQHYDRVRRAIQAIQRVHSKAKVDLHNLEAVFTILESALTVNKLPGFESSEIGPAIESFKKVITHTLDKCTTFQAISQPDHTGLRVRPPIHYHSFAQLIKEIITNRPGGRSASIITFNYDVALDYALIVNGVFPDYNLPDNECGQPSVALIKPHGSLNWGRQKGSQNIVALDTQKVIDRQQIPPEGRTIPYPVQFLVGSNIAQHFAEFLGVEAEDVPVLVPPGIFKAEHHRALPSVWGAAARELAEAEDILVIGFSLPPTDSFFTHLYALGTEGESVIRRFWVYNPDGTQGVRQRFLSILGEQASSRFEYKSYKFENAIGEIAQSYQIEQRPGW